MKKQILSQPFEGLCGQTCIALLKDISVEQVVREAKCGKYKMSGRRLFEALDLYTQTSHLNKCLCTLKIQ